MQIVTMMGQMLESGKITLSIKNKESLEIRAVNKKIDVNAKNKELLKDIIASVRDGGKNISKTETTKESPKMLKTAKRTHKMLIDIAEELKAAGITITLSYKGNVVATMGTQATAKVSRLVTGTKALEINSLLKLIELGI
jgi:hypothetical protein